MSHRILIVGGGAGGLELATRLGRTLGKRGKAKVTLVDANLTHIWKPLLHEVAAGSLNSSEDELNYVAQAKWNHFEFQLGRMTGLNRAEQRITLSATLDERGEVLVPERQLGYDSLVIAVGSTTNDFGTAGAAEHCLFLDTREQAERFHSQLLSHYLRAHASQSDTTEQINVAIVGAGATGVELAAELHHAAHQLAAYGLDSIHPENMRITLIEAGPRVLPALPERIGKPVH
uniref:NAD(P)/FAD-dependent oxidoreductase n=2 Tax=unclassified Pseudomonas TaxID=196821 RepID=UPI00262ABAD5